MGAAGLVYGPGQAGHDVTAGNARCGKGVARLGAALFANHHGYYGSRWCYVQQGPAHGPGGAQSWGRGQAGEQLDWYKPARVRGQAALGKRQRSHAVVHRNAGVSLLHVDVLQPVGLGIGAADAQVGRRILGAYPLRAGR